MECYNKFNVMDLIFEDFQKEVKNLIDKRVRDRLAGKLPPKVPAADPKVPKDPVPSPKPAVKQGNPFGTVLDEDRHEIPANIGLGRPLQRDPIGNNPRLRGGPIAVTSGDKPIFGGEVA